MVQLQNHLNLGDVGDLDPADIKSVLAVLEVLLTTTDAEEISKLYVQS